MMPCLWMVPYGTCWSGWRHCRFVDIPLYEEARPEGASFGPFPLEVDDAGFGEHLVSFLCNEDVVLQAAAADAWVVEARL